MVLRAYSRFCTPGSSWWGKGHPMWCQGLNPGYSSSKQALTHYKISQIPKPFDVLLVQWFWPPGSLSLEVEMQASVEDNSERPACRYGAAGFFNCSQAWWHHPWCREGKNLFLWHSDSSCQLTCVSSDCHRLGKEWPYEPQPIGFWGRGRCGSMAPGVLDMLCKKP